MPARQHAATGPWIDRFTLTERLLHWSNALAFLALAFTGFSLHLHFLNAAWARVLAPVPPLLGQTFTLIDLHIIIAMFYVAGPLVWIVIGNRRSLRADAQEIAHFDQDDMEWLAQVSRGEMAEQPPQGRFNAGQKLNAIASVLAFAGFVITGVLLVFWPNNAFGADTTFQVAGVLRRLAVLAHNLLGLASLALLAGHVYLAALNPSTRHSQQGMLRGRVRRSWAQEHHAKWVRAVDEGSNG
jgi:formate dehydrogenase subunit gamma